MRLVYVDVAVPPHCSPIARRVECFPPFIRLAVVSFAIDAAPTGNRQRSGTRSASRMSFDSAATAAARHRNGAGVMEELLCRDVHGRTCSMRSACVCARDK